MKKIKSVLCMAALALACVFTPTSAKAQPVAVSRPSFVPMAGLTVDTNGLGFRLNPQATNTSIGNPFVVLANHNVEFQFDLVATNGLGTSNVWFAFDINEDNQSAPSSWKSNAYTFNVGANLLPVGAQTLTFQPAQISNVPAFYMRLNSIGTSATNYLDITNFLYFPYP